MKSVFSDIRTSYIVHRTFFFAFISFCLLPIGLSAQNYGLEKVDSIHFRLCSFVVTENGSYSRECGPVYRADTVENLLVNILTNKRKAISEAAWQVDFNNLDTLLRKFSGHEYSYYVKSRLGAAIVGNWDMYYAGDTTTLIVDKSLKIRSGKLRGEIGIMDDQGSYSLNGILPDVCILKLDRDRLVGKLKDKAVTLVKIPNSR